MPIDKMGKTDVSSDSITFNKQMQKVLCCSECGESIFTLRRIRDNEGKKVTPAKYICEECYGRVRGRNAGIR